jgi:transcriptional regulator with XRE-family HTH domain
MSPRFRKSDDSLAREQRRAVGRALGILRRRRKQTVEDAAERTGIHATTYRLWERGEVEPNVENLRAALLAMQYDFHDLQDVLDAVENRPEEEREIEAEPTEEERLIREIARGFTELIDLRRRVAGVGKE